MCARRVPPVGWAAPPRAILRDWRRRLRSTGAPQASNSTCSSFPSLCLSPFFGRLALPLPPPAVLPLPRRRGAPPRSADHGAHVAALPPPGHGGQRRVAHLLPPTPDRRGRHRGRPRHRERRVGAPPPRDARVAPGRGGAAADLVGRGIPRDAPCCRHGRRRGAAAAARARQPVAPLVAVGAARRPAGHGRRRRGGRGGRGPHPAAAAAAAAATAGGPPPDRVGAGSVGGGGGGAPPAVGGARQERQPVHEQLLDVRVDGRPRRLRRRRTPVTPGRRVGGRVRPRQRRRRRRRRRARRRGARRAAGQTPPAGRRGAPPPPPPPGGADEDVAAAAAPKIRQHKNAAPSRYCHVCARATGSATAAAAAAALGAADAAAAAPSTTTFVTCKNIVYGVCRKTTCAACFVAHGWDWAAAGGAAGYVCTHCRKACPPGASCATYARTNRRRRAVGVERRRAIEAALASGGDVGALLGGGGGRPRPIDAATSSRYRRTNVGGRGVVWGGTL